jgi:hypothetical protein
MLTFFYFILSVQSKPSYIKVIKWGLPSVIPFRGASKQKLTVRFAHSFFIYSFSLKQASADFINKKPPAGG